MAASGAAAAAGGESRRRRGSRPAGAGAGGGCAGRHSLCVGRAARAGARGGGCTARAERDTTGTLGATPSTLSDTLVAELDEKEPPSAHGRRRALLGTSSRADPCEPLVGGASVGKDGLRRRANRRDQAAFKGRRGRLNGWIGAEGRYRSCTFHLTTSRNLLVVFHEHGWIFTQPLDGGHCIHCGCGLGWVISLEWRRSTVLSNLRPCRLV